MSVPQLLEPSRQAAKSPLIALAVVSVAVFLGSLDQTVIVTALPSVITEMRLPFTKLDQASWVVTGYLLGYTAAMPLMGRVSDVFGRRRVLLIALFVFTLASACCAQAWSLNSLVAARALQAIGGGAMVPVAMAMVGDMFAPHRRSMALGAIGAAAEAGGVLGPLYGAAIVELVGWRWVFWLNLPIAAIVVALCLTLLPRAAKRAERLDFVGALLLGGSMSLLTIALTSEANSPRPAYQTGLLLFGFAAFFLLFLLREAKTGQPMVDLRIFRSLPFSAANLTNFLVGGGLIVAMVNVPLFAVAVQNRPALDSGWILVRLTALIPVGAIAGGFVCRWLGYRPTTIAGLLTSATGFVLLSHWQLHVSVAEMTPGLILVGLGFGLVIAPVSAVVLNSVRQADAGVASAMVTVMRMLGQTLGLAGLTTWGLLRFKAITSSLSLPLPFPNETVAEAEARLVIYQEQVTRASMAVFNEVFLAAAVLCLIALVPVIVMRHTKDSVLKAGG